MGGGGGRMGVGLPVVTDGLETDDGLDVRVSDIVKELVSEEPVALDPALVGAGKLTVQLVKLVCDADVEPAGEELEIGGLGWLRLVLDSVELTDEESTDDESVFDGLDTVVIGREELLVGVLVTGGLLGGEGTGITIEVLLELLGREPELDRVVSVVCVET